MPQIKTMTDLVRHLTANPNLRMEYPAGVMRSCPNGSTKPRMFVRKTSRSLVFLTEDGQETHLDAKAKDLEFHDDHFAVRFPKDWNVPNNTAIRYFYVANPETAPCSTSAAPNTSTR